MRRRVVIASVIGNALEWFDFIVYGILAATIARVFFPAEASETRLLAALALFGIGFVMRPLGGIFFGIYADRYGRRAALSLVILLMGVGTALLAAAPGYAAIGIGAPLLVLAARMIQGFSVGGEFGTATTTLIEFAPPGRRGLYGSFQMISQALSFTLGGLAAFLITTSLSAEAADSWGWRLPFILGALVGPIGVYLRRRIDESPEFADLQATGKQSPAPLRAVFTSHKREVIAAFGIIVAGTSTLYVLSIYLPLFAAESLGLPMRHAQIGLACANVLIAIFVPVAGILSDRFGRRAIILPALVIFSALLLVMMHRLIGDPTPEHLFQTQMLGVFIAFIFGPAPALVAEIFPVAVRSTGLSIAYNLAVALFGGFAPFLNVWLVQTTGDGMAPVYYVLACVIVGIAGLFMIQPPATQGRNVQ
ncbi:MAG: MFS transporter [Methylobacteriaceae bacterium]|nr:MFS transporter [Methylobacteriaceae bacterium]